MSMNDRDLGTLVGIVMACDDVEGKLSRFGIDRTVWIHDRYLRDCVLMSIGRIGELAGKLSEECRSRFADVPWRQIRGMRNYIVHDYDNVNLDLAWDTVVNNAPALKERLLEDVSVSVAYEDEQRVIDDGLEDILSSMEVYRPTSDDLGMTESCQHPCRCDKFDAR